MDDILPKVPSSDIVDRMFEESVRGIHRRGSREIDDVQKKEGFFQTLMSSISAVREAQKEAREESVRMVLGEARDIHEVMLAREKAEVLFQLFLEIRNRIVQAFENIMRMQF